MAAPFVASEWCFSYHDYARKIFPLQYTFIEKNRDFEKWESRCDEGKGKVMHGSKNQDLMHQSGKWTWCIEPVFLSKNIRNCPTWGNKMVPHEHLWDNYYKIPRFFKLECLEQPAQRGRLLWIPSRSAGKWCMPPCFFTPCINSNFRVDAWAPVFSPRASILIDFTLLSLHFTFDPFPKWCTRSENRGWCIRNVNWKSKFCFCSGDTGF